MPTRKLTVLTIFALCATVALLALRTRAQVDAGSAGAGGSGQGAAVAVQVAAVPPKLTELEKLANQTGVLVTKGYTVVGELAGDDGSSVRVSAVQFTSAGDPGTRVRG